MPRLGLGVPTMPHSGIRTMAVLAGRVDGVLSLVAGDPNFTTPHHIIDAAAAGAKAGRTGYPPSAGFESLREAIAEKVRMRNGIDAGPREVVVTTGGCGGLFTSLAILLDPGDEVLIPDPGWSNYPPMAHMLHAEPVFYPLARDRGFAVDAAAIEERITARTRAVIVNSPGNPTGAVDRAEDLAAVVALAERHDLWVISDECYDEIVYDGEHTSTAAAGGRDRVVSVFTFSKSYAMTGWRVGYVVAPTTFADELGLAQEPVVASASGISQLAAEAALRGPQDVVGAMRDAYRDRLATVAASLDAARVGWVRPRGSFFCMLDISPSGLDSWSYARRLLDEERVAVVPGKAFGPSADGMVRLSLAVDPDVLEQGVARIIRTLR
jgi:aspartate aminotransferase